MRAVAAPRPEAPPVTTAEIDEFSFTVLFPHLWPCRSAAMTGALPHLLSGLLPQLI
jgi:hypothetical protein